MMFFARASIVVVLASVVVVCSKAAAAAEHDKHKQPRLRGLSAQVPAAASDADEYEYIDITDTSHNAVDWVEEEDTDVAPLDDVGEMADHDFATYGAEEEDWAYENDPFPDSDVFDDEDFAHAVDWLGDEDEDEGPAAEDLLEDEFRRQRDLMVGHSMYSPLQCNVDAAIDNDEACLTSAVSFKSLVEEYTSTTIASNGTTAAAPLVIPCGQCVNVDYDNGTTVTLPGGLDVVGRLHFPPTASVTINTTAVFVQGRLDMTEPAPGHSVTITLYGVEAQYLYPHHMCGGEYSSACTARQNLGSKPIIVAGGKLNVEAGRGGGACASWTRLVAKISNTELKVDPAFAGCVKPGDIIMVTSESSVWHGSLTRTVVSVDAATGILVLDADILRSLPGLDGPGEPEFAVEVAAMTRSVVFQAQEDNVEAPHIGGHLMVYHTPGVSQVISGVRFVNFGQGGILGRYPIHFHLSDNSPSLVSDNVIVQSNQRCIVVHNTNGVTVDNNVAHDTSGHCFVTETGLEEHNIFSNNLGAMTRKLHFWNGQSDSPGFAGKHIVSTFWVRNMNNEFYGNVAAGSESTGWWFEMKNINVPMLSTTPISSFRDNVAHSNALNGMTTYKPGWTPSTPAVFDNIRIYKNGGESGLKFHITGLLTIQNSLFADNKVSIRYGVWNRGVTVKNSKIIGLSNDAKLRFGWSCPTTSSGVYASYNNYLHKTLPKAITLDNVVMERFTCGSKIISPYFDGRQYTGGMGNPIQASVTITNSVEKANPSFGCGSNEKYVFLEDFNGGLGPASMGSDPGFILRNAGHMKAFLPPGACEPLPYGGAWSDGTKCNAFCKNVCLRFFHISPGIPSATKLVLSQGNVTYAYYLDSYHNNFRMVLPSGNYYGQFYDGSDVEVVAQSVAISAFRAPQCNDYADENSFTFATREPTTAPTAMPTRAGMTNLALGKPASFSCGYHTTPEKYGAYRAVDGIKDASGILFHTCNMAGTWWRVDLEAKTEIGRVNIYNRISCCQDRLSNFFVRFLDDAGAQVNEVYFAGAAGLVESIYPGDNVLARYVEIQLTGTNYLHLEEVEVMGWETTAAPTADLPAPPSMSITPTIAPTSLEITNLALGRPASFSCGWHTTPEKWGAYRAVDGIKDSTGILTHTCNMAGTWWRVDLEAVKKIKHVNIYNRIDCCQDRLSNFFVRFLDDAGAQVKEVYFAGAAGLMESIYPGDNVLARHVEIQLAGTNILNFVEVEVMGWELPTSSSSSNPPTAASNSPSLAHSSSPSTQGSSSPSSSPSISISSSPSVVGSSSPSVGISSSPSVVGSSSPSVGISSSPSVTGSNSPSVSISSSPSVTGSNSPSAIASPPPSVEASQNPTVEASPSPSSYPTAAPSSAPTSPSVVMAPRIAPTQRVITNLALRKPASFSCGWHTTPEKWGAYRAVDGIKDASGILTHTCQMAQPWWRVDLEATKEIEHVNIYNRIDCCQGRLSNFFVRFLDDGDNLIKEVYHSGSAGRFLVIDAGDNVLARHVEIQLTGTNIINFVEVEVMGWEPIAAPTASLPASPSTSITPTIAPTPSDITNLALGQPASFSCGYHTTPEKYGAYRAVDGIKDASGILFHTCNMAQPWWRVDLGAAKEIEHVTIYNRISCCRNRLSNFYVRFLDDAGAQVKEVYHSGSAGYVKTIDAGDNVSARYVEIQLAGTNYLHLEEVEVMGRQP